MAVEIDYEKRSIWRNVFDPGAWQNLLSGVGDVAGDVASTWELIEKAQGTVGLKEPEPPKVTWADFKFTPNWSLIILGGGLLVLALVLRKRK